MRVEDEETAMVRASQSAASAIPAYTVTARVLHWITAALVLIMVPLGVVIANEWGGPVQQPLYNLHKSIGAILLPLVAARLIYRSTHPPLPLPDDISPIQQLAAHADNGRHRAHSFIPIDERMILHEMEQISSSHLKEIREKRSPVRCYLWLR